MKKIALILALVMMMSLVFVGCGTQQPPAPPVADPPAQDTQPPATPEPPAEEEPPVVEYVQQVDWLSPMISIEKESHIVSLWSGEYNLHRNETMEYVFRDVEDEFNEIAITAEALLEGGAVPATLRLAYGGDGQHLVRVVAFAYSFFDHGRPTRIGAHTAEPNPQEIMVLWRNPENGHWFSMIQNGIGREAATLGQNHNELVSLRNGNPVYTFLLNSETVESLSELEVFIVATAAPTRESDYDRSGYSILFTLELPDIDNHFHSWELLAATGTMFVVEGNGYD